MRARFINEMSIEYLDPKDVITKDLLNSWQNDSYLDDLFLYSYAEEHGEDPEELIVNDFISTPEFEKWYEYEVESRYYETVNKFNHEIIEGDFISIWRAIKVDKNWLDHLQSKGNRLGIYWSWDKDAAEPHWGYDSDIKNIDVVIESKVKVEDINWIETIQMNMHPSYEEEKEIRLFKNTPLRIVSLEVDNKQIDISNIKNKIFKA